jgi:hypothetical protein
MTLRIQNLAVLASMARFTDFRTIVLDHTISPDEQEAVIRTLRDFSSLFHVICIGTKEVSSEAIVRECEACNRDHHRGGTHLLQVGPVLLP